MRMIRLELSFFNTFAVDLEGQPVTRFRSANYQGLLVYLALNSDRPQSRDVLAPLFWPEETDKAARQNLRQALYHLRTLLGDTTSSGEPFLTVTRHTAQLNRQSDYILDVHQFLEAIEKNDLQTAVAQYHGELLPGFTCDSLQFEEWLRQERESLHQLALETMSEATQDHLAAGRLEQARETARRQLSLEPWRERAFRQLMRANALAGNRGNALAQFEACRTVLEEELGVEPAEETVALYEEIKSARYGGIGTKDVLRPPLRVKNNLPADTTPLVGREMELSHLDRQFSQEQQRLVTIVAPGGMGKTRLAIAAGVRLLRQFTDGVYLVDLAPLAEPEEIIPAVAAALEYQVPDSAKDLKPQLLDFLGRRSLLLIFDNFEHLLAGTGHVDDILKRCPKVAILVTTRQRLNLASESRYELSGLAYPESVAAADGLDYTALELFTAAANRVRTQFLLSDENVADVIQICRLVQGMPLGLLLAAAWLELLEPAEIAGEIANSLDFLAADLADLPSRQRSMQAVFERSWEMMTAGEKLVLAKLSVFRGGCTREAAEEVAGANLRVLLALVNKSLLQRQPQSGRFAMHELLRQYATLKRHEIDADDQALQAHCCYFARLIPEEVRRSLSFYPYLMRQRYPADRDNFYRAWDYALEHGRAGELSDLARGIADFSFASGILPESILSEASQALERRGLADTDPALLHLRLVKLAALAGNAEVKRRLAELHAFLPRVEEQGDPELLFWSYDQMRELCRDMDDPQILTWVGLMHQAAVAMEDEVLTKTAEAYLLWARTELRLLKEDEEDDVLRRLHTLLADFEPDFANSFVVFILFWSLCIIHFRSGQAEKAVLYGQRGLNIAKGWQNLWWISNVFWTQIWGYLEFEEPEKARVQLLDCLEWHLAIGQEWQTLGLLMTIFLYIMIPVGDQATTLSFLSMVYNHPEINEHFRAVIEKDRAGIETGMDAKAVTAAWERGKELDFETVISQVRAALAGVE